VLKGANEGSVGTADGIGLGGVAGEGFWRWRTTGCFACPTRFGGKSPDSCGLILASSLLPQGLAENLAVSTSQKPAFEHPNGFGYAHTRTFSETDVQALLLLLNPFKVKEFVGW